MPITLDDDDERLLRELADHTGESHPEALRRALHERFDRLRSRLRPSAEADASGDLAALRPGFEIRLLGHPVVRWHAGDGTVVEASWRMRRAFLAVAYLATQVERRGAKEELVEALWPETTATKVARNFHPAISDARRGLLDAVGKGGASGGSKAAVATVSHRDGVYLLDPGTAWWIDVERFRSELYLAEAARRAAHVGPDDLDDPERVELHHLKEAWTHYRGPLLAGHDAEWIEGPRSDLRRQWLAVLRRIGELASRRAVAGAVDEGPPAESDDETLALDAWRRLLMEEPFEEKAHLAVMELYARRGRRDLVRRQFVKLQEHLMELDVEPAAETQARYLELMR